MPKKSYGGFNGKSWLLEKHGGFKGRPKALWSPTRPNLSSRKCMLHVLRFNLVARSATDDSLPVEFLSSWSLSPGL